MKSQDIEIIRKSLQREPVHLADRVWDALRRYQIVRTPQEQQHRLLKNAPDSAKDDSAYSADFKRSLNAALALDPRTSALTITFKDGTKDGLDLLLDNSDLLIHDKWLEFSSSHEKTPCSLSTRATQKGVSIENFSCNHVVAYLLDLLLAELTKVGGAELDSHTLTRSDDSLRVAVRENLDQMPRLVEASIVEPGEIKVTWMDLDGDRVSKLHGLDPQCGIVMHRESTCSNKRLDLLRLRSRSTFRIL